MVGAHPCVNHPRRETRVACSACGNPICPACMRETPVGMKCPACARQSRHARGYGNPEHYARAIAYGLGSALAFGILLNLVAVGVFGIILPIVVGLVVGLATAKGARGLRHTSIAAIAAACAVVGLLAGGLLTGSSLRGVLAQGQVLGIVISGIAAAFVAHR